MYFRIACREEPFRSFNAIIAAEIISIYVGCSAGLAGFLAGLAGADILTILLNFFSNFSSLTSLVFVSMSIKSVKSAARIYMLRVGPLRKHPDITQNSRLMEDKFVELVLLYQL